jgi:hypothetical protein
MKKPAAPPRQDELLGRTPPERLPMVLREVTAPTVKGEYLHWDKLRYHAPPSGMSHEEWWLGLKLRRSSAGKAIPLAGSSDRRFWYTSTESIAELLHNIDLGAGGTIQMPEQITNPDTRDRYCVSSLIEEAITSSQLEGAVTTRRVAKEMLRCGRKPSDRSERMILNNFITM